MRLAFLQRRLLPIFLLLFAFSLYGKQSIHIALIFDGPAVREQTFFNQVQEELIDLLQDEHDVSFYYVENFWTLQGASANVRGALNDPNIDLIITLGILSSYQMLEQQALAKPVVIGYNLSIFSEYECPFKVQQSPKIGFFQSELTLQQEVSTFAQITNSKTLGIIGDASLIGYPDFPIIRNKIEAAMNEIGVKPFYIPIVDSEIPAFDALEEVKVDGVVLLPTWRMGTENFKALISGINDRFLPSFSVFGEGEVKQGVLMTLTPEAEVKRSARRVALDAQELLLSGNNQEMVFNFFRAQEMIINEKTAQAIDIDLPWKVLREAVFIDRVKPLPSQVLQFVEATEIAVQNNLDLLTEYYVVKSGWQDVLRRFSRLMPQLNSRLEGRIIDSNSASAGVGFQPEKLIRSTLSFSQVLYDEKKVSDFSIEQKSQKAREYNRQSIEYDIILDTAVAYLTVLRIKADLKIAQENIDLSKANLKRAHELVDSGQARLSEVYRWESELASNRDAYVALEAVLENIETEFNRLLNRPLRMPVILEDINPFDTQAVLDYGHLVPYLNTPAKFGRFKEYMMRLARDNSPDIKRVDQEVLAEERRYTATKRAYYLPEFSAFGDLSNNLYRGGTGTATAPGVSSGKLESRIGVAITYPIFTSGLRNSEKNKAFFETQKLRTERASLTEKIDELVIQSIDNMKSSYEGIFLAKQASEAAEKNLVIVTNSYVRGVVSIVDLLDAQNKMIVSKQSYYNSLYDYLIDYMEFQRATSQFDFFLDRIGKDDFKQEIIKYINQEAS